MESDESDDQPGLMDGRKVLALVGSGVRANALVNFVQTEGGVCDVHPENSTSRTVAGLLNSPPGSHGVYTDLYLSRDVGLKKMKEIVNPLCESTSQLSDLHIIAEGGSAIYARFQGRVAHIQRAPFTVARLRTAFSEVHGKAVERDTSNVVELTSTRPPGIEEARAEGRLILLAEDNPTNQMVIGRQLSLLGYAHEAADDGVEALKMLKEGKYGLLLTDLHMPEMNGYELASDIRRREEAETSPALPIIAVTADAQHDRGLACLEAGMNGYLSKPMDLASLRGVLQQWLPMTKTRSDDRVSEHIESPASAGPTASSVLRLEVLDEIFGGLPYDLEEVLQDFQKSASDCVSQIELGFSDDDKDLVSAGSHKLKSSSRTIGADSLANVCQSLERCARQGNGNEIADHVMNLRIEMKSLQSAIEKQLRQS